MEKERVLGMYFIDRSKLERHLLYMDGLLQQVEHLPLSSWQEKMALERTTQMIIESIIDVGNMMIDGFIMRDPGGYEDIIDILVDEKVLEEKDSDSFKAVLHLRKQLVRDYLNINHDELKRVLKENWTALEKFTEQVRTYLNNELGVYTAFKPEDK